MKKYELLPTDENLIKTYLNDTISRNNDIYHFVNILSNLDDCYSIALDGAWGSGKTFFVKQVKMILDVNNEYLENEKKESLSEVKQFWDKTYNPKNCKLIPQFSVYYDAWENDNDKDPVLSLVYTILQNVDTSYLLTETTSIINLATQVFDFFSGKDLTKLIEALKGDDPLKELRNEKNIQGKITEFFDSIFPEKGDRLVIFIDELDRCNPAFAVKLLERIKHYFTNDRITFVFSTNINELQHTIKKFYGTDFNACKYLDRFFDLRVSLPPPNLQKYYQSLNFNNYESIYNKVCAAVINSYNFELREISKYIQMSRIVYRKNAWSLDYPEDLGKHFCYVFVIPILIGLKINDIDKYNSFINGKDCLPMKEIAEKLDTELFNRLLTNGETYEENSKDKIVTIESKLKAVYERIFSTDYTNFQPQKGFGKCLFDGETRDFVIKTVSLLSSYSNFDCLEGEN